MIIPNRLDSNYNPIIIINEHGFQKNVHGKLDIFQRNFPPTAVKTVPFADPHLQVASRGPGAPARSVHLFPGRRSYSVTTQLSSN